MGDKEEPEAKEESVAKRPKNVSKDTLFYNPEAYTGELTQSFITENIKSQILIREKLIVPYKDLTQDKIDAIIDYIRQYNDMVEQRTIIRGELGQYVVITSSAHANLLIEDTTLGKEVVEQIRDESTILQVWVKLYRETYGEEPVPLEISRFERYANQCMIISQVSCGVCGIFEEADEPKEGALQEDRVLSSREVEQATIQTFMTSLVDSGIPITNNVMQLIIYFTRHVLRATFDSNYGRIMETIGDADPDKPWYEQIQEIADSHTSWSSYPINAAKNICKNFTCESTPGETERYYANYGMHVNLMGDVVIEDISIRNIMTNPAQYIEYIKIRNQHAMSNPNINIAIRAIESLHETHQTNLAALFSIANAFKLRLALFDSGCEYYQDQAHVKVLRCGKVVASEAQKVESEKIPARVKEMQPPADSQRDDYWAPELGGGRRRRTTKKKPRRRAKRKTNRPKGKYKYRYTKRKKHNNKRLTQ